MPPSWASQVKQADRSPRAARTWVPFAATPPTDTVPTFPALSAAGSFSQSSMLPERSASGKAASSFAFSSSDGNSTRL